MQFSRGTVSMRRSSPTGSKNQRTLPIKPEGLGREAGDGRRIACYCYCAHLSFCGTDGTNWMPDPDSTKTIQGCKHRKVRSSTTPLRRVSRLDSALDVVLEMCRLPVARPWLPTGWCGDPPTNSPRDNDRLPVAQLSCCCPPPVGRKRFLGC